MESHDVPFVSQYEGITDPAWQWRGCGVVGLKMVLDYWHQCAPSHKTASVTDLFETGIAIGAYREGIGWTHRGLVDIATRYGYGGGNTDHAPKSPTPKTTHDSWQQLQAELAFGPILTSVYSGMNPERGGGHIVVVTGFSDGLVSFLDPKETTEREGRKILAIDRFLGAFKLRYITIVPAGPVVR